MGLCRYGGTNMRKENDLKRKKVRDPHQRTITGRIVHFLWILVAACMLLTMTVGISGGVAGKLLLDRSLKYYHEDI